MPPVSPQVGSTTPSAPSGALDPRLARRVRFVGLDVDGVLTDGGIYLGDSGGSMLEFKRYDIQDGLGIHFLQAAGLHLGIVTGRVSESVRLRAAELRIDDVAQDALARKLPALLAILERRGVALDEAAFIGDDYPDMAIMRVVGLPVCVGNAVPEIQAVSAIRLRRSGGRGAVREFAEILLKARGEWEAVTEEYVASRSRLEHEVAR
jgi:3-deoxy-D-manno-octulosonate 8-phosphate phosphatase (KDO 8-P phosphatase)